jgi:LPS export ABC transporter protein LptC
MKTLSFLFFFVIFFSCKNSVEEIREITASPAEAPETGSEIELIYSDSARIKFKLIAGRLERKDGDNPITEFFDGVKIIFYDAELKPESEIRADYAIHYEKEEKMVAKNNVVVVNIKGETLNTEELTWEQQKHLVYTDVFVKITTADETLYGDGLESNEDFTKYKIKKIKGTINRKE